MREHSDAEVAAICTRVRPEYQKHYDDAKIQVIEATNLSKIFSILKTHRLIIGGGQMLTGDRSMKGLIFVLLICMMARFRGHRARLIGIGVEGVKRFRAKFLVRRIISSCEWIGCRDQFSLDMLKAAGCKESKLRLLADVVFSGICQRELLSNMENAPIAVGLHHSPMRDYADESLYVQMIQAIRRRFPERSVTVVSNDSRPRYDAGLLDRLKAQIDDEKVDWLHFETLEKTLDAYGSSACVVSVRMHPLILALIHGARVVGIAKSNKVKALAKASWFFATRSEYREHRPACRFGRRRDRQARAEA